MNLRVAQLNLYKAQAVHKVASAISYLGLSALTLPTANLFIDWWSNKIELFVSGSILCALGGAAWWVAWNRLGTARATLGSEMPRGNTTIMSSRVDRYSKS